MLLSEKDKVSRGGGLKIWTHSSNTFVKVGTKSKIFFLISCDLFWFLCQSTIFNGYQNQKAENVIL